MHHKLVLILLSVYLFFGAAIGVSASDSEETYFVATAYYSPLEGQSRYTTGSYWGDIRLNGEGHTTASGKGVFPGLLAGPSNYPFGTKIHFEGYGVGSIEDRGGAIVKAGVRGHGYDRIDIWMGYGDEGLERALKWGTRTIKGKIVVPSTTTSLSFDDSPLGSLRRLQVNPEESKPEHVEELQTILSNAELYDGEIDGEYESIEDFIIEFQLSNNIILSADDEAAGWYGPATMRALKRLDSGSSELLNSEDPEIFAQTNHPEASAIYKLILEYGNLQVKPESESEDIIALQNLMTQLGEYSGPIDGNYSSIKKPLLNYQKKIGMISSDRSWGAGYFGNKTKSSMWVYYEKLEENKSNKIPDVSTSLEEVEVVEPYVISGSYTLLSKREKEQLVGAVNTLRQKFRKEELSGKPSALSREENLKKALKAGLSRFDDKKLKQKLGYILEILNSTTINN